jgi:hypothetical protein
MKSFTATGSTITHTPTATAIGDPDRRRCQHDAERHAFKRSSGHDVIVHGDKAGNFIVVDMITHPQQIADAILSNPAYRGVRSTW